MKQIFFNLHVFFFYVVTIITFLCTDYTTGRVEQIIRETAYITSPSPMATREIHIWKLRADDGRWLIKFDEFHLGECAETSIIVQELGGGRQKFCGSSNPDQYLSHLPNISITFTANLWKHKPTEMSFKIHAIYGRTKEQIERQLSTVGSSSGGRLLSFSDIAYAILAVFLGVLVTMFITLFAYYVRETRRRNGNNIEESVISRATDLNATPKITRYIKDTRNNKSEVSQNVTEEPCPPEPCYEIPITQSPQTSDNDICKVTITPEPAKINGQKKNLKQIAIRTISEANNYIRMARSSALSQSRETSLNLEQEIPPRYSEIGRSTEV